MCLDETNSVSPLDQPSWYPGSTGRRVLVPQSHRQDIYRQGASGAGQSHQVSETSTAQRQSWLLHHSLCRTGMYFITFRCFVFLTLLLGIALLLVYANSILSKFHISKTWNALFYVSFLIWLIHVFSLCNNLFLTYFEDFLGGRDSSEGTVNQVISWKQ